MLFLGNTGARGETPLPLPRSKSGSGAAAAPTLPVLTPYGLSGCDRRGGASPALPDLAAAGWSCGLVDPVRNALASNTVVALLCQGEAELALAAAALGEGSTLASVGPDALAGILLAAVAGTLAYADDGDDEVWTCALGTYCRGTGDCEDGAVLLHGLLLASGLAADRLVTTFGRVGIDRQGHAWLNYRRASDGNWVVLDWTAGPATGGVAALPPVADAPYYAVVDHALTAQAFFPVRQDAATFFSRIATENLPLPAVAVSAGASLGGRAGCAFGSGWLRAVARTAARGGVDLPGPETGASAGSVSLAAPLPRPALAAGTGLPARAGLCAPGILGQALGASARGQTLVIRPTLAGQARQAGVGRAPLVLARARLAATGVAGLGGTLSVWATPPVLAARAWTGRMAEAGFPLIAVTLTAAGGPTGPGHALGILPPWSARGDGSPDGAALVAYRWKTSNQEAW